MTLCSYGDRLVVSIASPYRETDIQRTFFQSLSKLGIKIEIIIQHLKRGMNRMQYCSQCQAPYPGTRKDASYAETRFLTVDPDEGLDEMFPIIPPTYESHLAIRILVFISLAAVISSFAIRMIFPSDVNWPVFVVFGLVSMWLGLIVVVRKRHNIPKTVLWQVAVVTLLSVFWDWQTGWGGWSLNYLIPIVFVAAELVMYITAKIIEAQYQGLCDLCHAGLSIRHYPNPFYCVCVGKNDLSVHHMRHGQRHLSFCDIHLPGRKHQKGIEQKDAHIK